jgi:hypothetical protein
MVNTLSVNRRLARGQLYRLVRCVTVAPRESGCASAAHEAPRLWTPPNNTSDFSHSACSGGANGQNATAAAEPRAMQDLGLLHRARSVTT